MKQTSLNLNPPTKSNSKKKVTSKKESSTIFSESSRDPWIIFNKKTNLRITNIRTNVCGRIIPLGSAFDTREDARDVKKILEKDYPRRTFDIKKLKYETI